MAGTQGQPSGAIQDVPPAIVSCTLWVPCEIQGRKTETVFLPLEKEMLCSSRVVKPAGRGIPVKLSSPEQGFLLGPVYW